MSEQYEVSVSRTIPAPRKKVFEAWLSAEALKQFMRPAEGVTVPKIEVDARVGGSYFIAMTAGDKELPHRGEYKEINRYDRIAFTWLSGFTTPESLVTIDFVEVGPNETEVKLHHVGFPNEESRGNHEGGWNKIVEALAQLVS